MPSLKFPLLGTIIFAIFTIAMYFAALDVQHGGIREFSGRHALIKNFIYSIGSKLGPVGSLILGGLITLMMLIWLITAIRKRRGFSK
jgi:hypothetical protein